MDASHPQGEAVAGAGAWITVEEWSGSSASALSRTAVLTASASSLTSHRFGSRWGRIGGRLLGAFVPEVSGRHPRELHPSMQNFIHHCPICYCWVSTSASVAIPFTCCRRRQQLHHLFVEFARMIIAARECSPLLSHVERPLGLMSEHLYWQGFPGSVTPDYVPFQLWDTLQVSSSHDLIFNLNPDVMHSLCQTSACFSPANALF